MQFPSAFGGQPVGRPVLDDPRQVGVERALNEFRAARPVRLSRIGETLLALPVDGLVEDRLAAFLAVCGTEAPRLVVTAQRAHALGIDASKPVSLALPSTDLATVFSLSAASMKAPAIAATPASFAARSALDLAKLAERLPAVLIASGTAALAARFDPPVVDVEADAIAEYRARSIGALQIAGEADIPLEVGETARFVIFRSPANADCVAVVVGKPVMTQPVPVRLHSACLTGEVFGSRRCDCGDQLRLAIEQLATSGGGIILYLPQEGRGLGLSNKMRTYGLQNAGYDTVDANMSLGFDDDERDYRVAGRMLEMLGCTRIQLLTNNPAKIAALTEHGIDVPESIPLFGPVNGDNLRYLTTKAKRAGHTLENLLERTTATPSMPDRS